jgi:acyl transferase domain-containing protein
MGIWRKSESRPVAAPALFALSGRDRRSLAATLERLALIAPRLADRERQDLAAQWCREARAGGGDGEIRVAFLARGNDQLVMRARLAADLVSAVRPGPVTREGGVYLSCGAGGRVTLLFPGGDGVPAAEAAALATSLRSLGTLDRFGVTPAAAVGAGLGELTGLVWAGSLAATEASRLITQHGQLRRAAGMTRTALARVPACYRTTTKLAAACGLFVAAYEGPHSHVLGGPVAAVRDLARQTDALGLAAEVLDADHALHTPVMAPSVAPLRSVLAQVRFASPRRRLLSTVTGRRLTGQDDLAALLCAQLTIPIRFREALAAAADGAALLVMAAPDEALAAAAACSGVPVVSFPADGQGTGACAAALFVAGALPNLANLVPAPSAPEPAVPIRVAGAAAGREAAGVEVAAGAGVRGRFLETITSLRPGAELRAEIRLSARTDPYLADYLEDGQPVFPAAMALEAMAQAASALTRQPLRAARQVLLGQPVPVPADGETRLRVRARVVPGGVETILHAGTGAQFAECARAVFAGAAGAGPDRPDPGTRAAGDGTASEPAPPPALVDGADLYGTACFQTGRFRRVAIVSGRLPKSCRAIVRGHDDAPWFEQVPEAAGPHELMLGSPGLNDAALQVAQACVPGRVLRPGGCDSLTATGAHIRGAVELKVFLISGPARPRPGAEAAGDHEPAGEYVWDIHGYDGTGQLVLALIGLRMRDAGPLPSRRARGGQRASGAERSPQTQGTQLAAVPSPPPAAASGPLRILA